MIAAHPPNVRLGGFFNFDRGINLPVDINIIFCYMIGIVTVPEFRICTVLFSKEKFELGNCWNSEYSATVPKSKSTEKQAKTHIGKKIK